MIDDRESMRDKWEAEGGTFIHHTSVRRTIRQLMLLVHPGGAWSAPELAATQEVMDSVARLGQDSTRGDAANSIHTDIGMDNGFPEELAGAIGGDTGAMGAVPFSMTPDRVKFVGISDRWCDLCCLSVRAVSSKMHYCHLHYHVYTTAATDPRNLSVCTH